MKTEFLGGKIEFLGVKKRRGGEKRNLRYYFSITVVNGRKAHNVSILRLL
jgi:hypothetical protein